MFRLSDFHRESPLSSSVGSVTAFDVSPFSVASLQIQQEAQFPRLTTPTFDALITFHQEINRYRAAHPIIPLPNLTLLVDGKILQYVAILHPDPVTAENLFNRLAELLRPEFASDRVAYLERLSFNPSLQFGKFGLTLSLSEYIEHFLFAADLLQLPAKTVYALFPRGLQGPFGSLVNLLYVVC